MANPVKFAAFVLVYYLIVYLFAVRRGGQQFLPWALLILVQALSVFFYQKVLEFVKQLPFLERMPSTGCKVITVGGLVLANILLILLVNLLFQKKDASAEKDDYVVNVDDIAPMWEQAGSRVEESDPQHVTVEEPPANTKEPADEFNIDDETIIETIHELSKNGNHEEAMKYLRMVVYFSKNDSIVEQAKNMLTEMQEEKG